jgi:hypothetical protein
MQTRQPGITRGALYGLITVYVCIVGMLIGILLYINYVNQRNDHRWCRALIAIDEAYDQARNNPNTSPAGKHIAEEFHRLRIEFEC